MPPTASKRLNARSRLLFARLLGSVALCGVIGCQVPTGHCGLGIAQERTPIRPERPVFRFLVCGVTFNPAIDSVFREAHAFGNRRAKPSRIARLELGLGLL